jgi:hypothetical protein
MEAYDHKAVPRNNLALKNGDLVILMRTIRGMENLGMCKNAKLRVFDVESAQQKRHLKVQKVGDSTEKFYLLPRLIFENCKCDELQGSFRRIQFPVELAYAMSINRSQGGTFDRILLDTSQSAIFSHGQLFVAMSRVRRQSDFGMFCSSSHLERNENGVSTVLCVNVVLQLLLNSGKASCDPTTANEVRRVNVDSQRGEQEGFQENGPNNCMSSSGRTQTTDTNTTFILPSVFPVRPRRKRNLQDTYGGLGFSSSNPNDVHSDEALLSLLNEAQGTSLNRRRVM